jgi:hypothetical protein
MLKLETKADLEALHQNQIQESTTLEYKASPSVENRDSRKQEIAKDVSAMANANGGQFVYGMTESNHLPTGLDEGIPPQPFNGLWFEQIIQQNVRPHIGGLRIVQIPIGNGNVAVVKDGRYYRRRNFRNDIMEDYEVREAMNRSMIPEPYAEILLPSDPLELEWTADDTHSRPIKLIARVGNRSSSPALYTYVSLFLDAELVITSPGSRDMSDATYSDGHPMKALSFALVTPHHFPLFKEKTFRLGEGTSFAIQPQYRTGDSLYRIAYEISTPGYSKFRAGEIIKNGNRLRLFWKKDTTE